MRMRIGLGWALALGLILPAEARSPVPAYYMDPEQVDFLHVLPPPPAPGSPAQAADLKAVLDAQAARTPDQVAQAQGDAAMSVFRLGDLLGPGFTAARLPLTAAFFKRVTDDAEASVEAAKAHYHRPRPFLADPAVQPVVPRLPNASYPSGHSTFAHVAAVLLADMLPEDAPALFARAEAYSHNRIVAGAHYPTDVEAGRIAGSVIDNVLLHDAHALADMAAVRTELRAGLGLPP